MLSILKVVPRCVVLVGDFIELQQSLFDGDVVNVLFDRFLPMSWLE